MCVSNVFQYNLKDGQSPKEVVDQVQHKLLHLGAKFNAYYVVECDIYQPLSPTSLPRTSYLINHSEYPFSCFTILEPIIYTNILIADKSYELFFSKLSPLAYSKKLPKIQCKGASYKIKDFIIKIGIVTFGANFKGILLEVEYLPCMIPSNCSELIKEFIIIFMGSNDSLSNLSSQLTTRMNEVYTPTDTILQYLDFFNSFRKITI